MFARPVWFVALVLAGVVIGVPGTWAQQQPAGEAKAESAAPAGDPGEEEGESAANAEQQQLRRRLATSTSAQLKLGDNTVALSTGILKTEDPDYASIAELKEGNVLLLTRSQAIKLKTDVPLTLGDVTLKTGNVAEGYPGVYGVWIKKTAGGWAFAFNEKPDLWGTMFNPADVIAEVPVQHKTLAEPTDALKFELPQEGQGGAIKMSWGEHEWTAPFTVAN